MNGHELSKIEAKTVKKKEKTYKVMTFCFLITF